ncbi:MAG: hypothetical protein AMXMBFR34_12150 [Myxococcaceae bacterium]
MRRALAVLLLGLACATTPPVDATAAAQGAAAASGAQVLAGLYRGPCLGRCPEYQVLVFGDGKVQWRGERNVAVLGEAWGELSQEQLAALQQLFLEHRFASFAARYEHLDTTDLPLVILSYGPRMVRHAHGDSGAPKELTDLEDAVDRLVGTAQWVKGPEQ